MIVNKDQITALDGQRKDKMKSKGATATRTTCNVFRLLTREEIPNHFIKQKKENAFLAQRCEMFPLEIVIRRIATGSYLDRNPGIKKGTVFPKCRVEFFLKDDQRHDPYIDINQPNGKKWLLFAPKQPIAGSQPMDSITAILSPEEVAIVKKMAYQTFEAVERAWAKQKVVLWDMKIEFGRNKKGQILVADVIDNDSWRITKEGQQLDKQVYRDKKLPLKEIEKLYRQVAEMTDRFSLPNSTNN